MSLFMGPALILPEKNWGACVSSKHHYSGAPSLHCALETSTFSYPPVNCTSKQNKQTAEMSPLSQSGLLPILLLTSLVLHKVPFFFFSILKLFPYSSLPLSLEGSASGLGPTPCLPPPATPLAPTHYFFLIVPFQC